MKCEKRDSLWRLCDHPYYVPVLHTNLPEGPAQVPVRGCPASPEYLPERLRLPLAREPDSGMEASDYNQGDIVRNSDAAE